MTGATFNIDGTLTVDNATVDNIIENFAAGTFTNDGTIQVIANSSLLLLNDTLDDYNGSNPGAIQVDAGSTLELQDSTIDGNAPTVTGATFNIDGTLTVDNATVDNIIENFAAGTFTNDGTIQVIANSSLLLLNDTLDDYNGSNPGAIQVDAGSTLELQDSTIDGNAPTVTGATFNIDGTLTVDNATVDNIIENFAAGTFTNDGTIQVIANSSLLLLNDTLDDYNGSNPGAIQVDAGSTLELQDSTIDGNAPTVTGATFNIDGTLTVDNATVDNIIENFAAGTFTNDGTIQVIANSSLLLLNDTLDDYNGSNPGAIQVDAGSTLELQDSTIDGNAPTVTGATFNIDGTLTVDNATVDNIIENFAAGTFTNDGTIQVIANSSLLLLNDTLDDYNGSNPGAIQVDAGSTLELQDSTIDGNAPTVTGATFNIDGTLTVDNATVDNIIENFAAGTFTNDGTIQVIANSSLLLLNDTLDDYNGSNPGAIQVDAGSTLELQDSTIDGNAPTVTGATFNIDGTLTVDNATVDNIIENFAAGTFTNDGTIQVIANSSLLLLNDTLDDYNGSNPGAIQVDAGSTLELQDSTIDGNAPTVTGATFNIDGTLTVDNATVDNIIENFAAGTFTNDGTIQVIANSSLLLLNDTLDNSSGVIQVDDASSTLDLTNSNINGGIINDYGLIEGILGASFINSATINIFGTGVVDANGVTLTIDPSFITNTGLLEATGGGTLVLIQDDVANAYGGNNGTVKTDASSTLDLDATSITGGYVINYHLLEATGGTTSTIDSAETFSNYDKLLVTGDGTTLVLANETVSNTGTVQIDAAVVPGNDPILNLVNNAVIDGGTIVNNGLLVATGGASVTVEKIENVSNFTNNGKLYLTDPVVADPGTTLLLLDDNITNNGTVEIGSSQTNAPLTLELQGTTITGGTIIGRQHIYVSGGTTTTIENGISFESHGKLLVTGSGTKLLLSHETLNNKYSNSSLKNGTVQIDNGAFLELQNAYVYSRTKPVATYVYGSVKNFGTIEATAGTDKLNGAIISNSGDLLVKNDGTTLFLAYDTITNTGDIHVYPRSNAAADPVSLVLKKTTITGGHVYNNSVLKAVGGLTSTIEDASKFYSNGKVVVTGAGTTLVLKNEALHNTFGGLSGENGRVYVYAGSTLDLQDAKIYSHSSLVHPELFGAVKNYGLIAATAGTDYIIGAMITNSGELLVTNDGTSLWLANDTVANSGKIQIDHRTDAYAAFLTLDLKSTDIIGGDVFNSSRLVATSGSAKGLTSTIKDVTNFINRGLLLVAGDTTTLVLDSETLHNYYGGISHANGTVQVNASDTLKLQSVTIYSHDDPVHTTVYGAIINAGTIEFDLGRQLHQWRSHN